MKWFYYLLYIGIFCNACGLFQQEHPHVVHQNKKIYKSGTLQDKVCLLSVIKDGDNIYAFWSNDKLNPEYAEILDLSDKFRDIVDRCTEESNDLNKNIENINNELNKLNIPAHAVGTKNE